MKEICKNCGLELLKTLSARKRSDSTVSFVENKLPMFPRPDITLPAYRVKKFNDNLEEIASFAAWVCGAPIQTFCLLDQIAFISKITGINQLSGDSCPIDEELKNIIEEADR